MGCLPLKQLSKSQRSLVELQIEPDAKIMQSHLRCQTSLKASQVMRAFTSQAEGIEQLVMNRFNDLSQVGQPSAQGFGPTLFAALMWGSEQIHLIRLSKVLVRFLTGKAFISYIRPLRRTASRRQTGRGSATRRKQGRSQVLIVCAGAAKAEASNHSLGGDTQQEMKALIPPNAIAPADISLACQPAQATPFGITSHGSSAVEDFVVRLLRVQDLNQIQGEGRDLIAMAALLPIELAPIGQMRKCLTQVVLRVAVKRSFAWELHPLAKQGQRHDLASAQGRFRSGFWLFWFQLRLAKIINHDVQCCYEGFQIGHQRAPLVWFAHCTIWNSSFQPLSEFTPNVIDIHDYHPNKRQKILLLRKNHGKKKIHKISRQE
jgi:hypothetical protein